MVRHSPKLFRLRWLKAVPISTSAVWNLILSDRSASGMCGTTAIVSAVATMIALKATTCVSGPTARRANSAGNARHQPLPRNGFCRHGAVRHQIGDEASVWNGKITKATTDMSGWPIGLFADILHAFRNVARNALIQGRLLVPWRPRLWVSSTDAFGKPEQHPGRWIRRRIRF